MPGVPINLGFLGLGHMGLPMAERLLGPETRLHVFDPSSQAVQTLTRAGAIAHSSPRSVADRATIVMACLPNRDVSTEVASGRDGVAKGEAIKIYVEMSTIGRECIESIAATLGSHGIRMVDAPVSGGPGAARAGNLTVMTSGATDDLAAVTPWLQRIGKKVHVLGDRPGQAQIMKLVNNLIMATNVVVAAEGLLLGVKAGLDPQLMAAVLNSSSGHSFASAEILTRSALAGTFNFGAALAIVAKDVELGLEEAHALAASVPVIERAGDLWHRAMEQGLAAEDFTIIVKLIEARSGASLRRSEAEAAMPTPGTPT